MAKDWTALLKSVLPYPRFPGRPFVCKGFPDDSQVLLIGKEPATDLGPNWNWWKYWDEETGFDYDDWTEYYEKKRGEPSDTRSVLNVIRQRGFRTVETNVYHSKADRWNRNEVSNLRVLRLLRNEMSDLRAIVAFGDKAKETVWRELKPPTKLLIPRRHFAARPPFSEQEIDELCKEIKKKLAARPT